MQPERLTFKDRLRMELYYNSLSVKELSHRTNISYSTLLKYLSKDSCMPDAEKAVLIAKELNVTVEYLVTGMDPIITVDNPKNEDFEKLCLLSDKYQQFVKKMISFLYDDIGNITKRSSQ